MYCKYNVALKWAMAHNESKNPDSVPIDITDCYDEDIQETRRMMHSSGPEHAPRRGGADNKISPANDYLLLID